MKTLTALVLTLSFAACQSTPKVPRQPTQQTAMEGGGNNSASGTMSGTPATGGTDPRGAGDDAPSTQQPQPTTTPTPEPQPLPQPIPPNPMPPQTDAGTSSGGTSSGPNTGTSSNTGGTPTR